MAVRSKCAWVGVGRHDVGNRDPAGVLVGAPDGRGDAGEVAEQCFPDHPRVDVVAAADDEILCSSGEVDEAVGVEAARSPVFSQPSWTRSSRLTLGPSSLGSGDLAAEHDGPVDHQEADFARGAVHPGPIVAHAYGLDPAVAGALRDRPDPFCRAE
jgi:hypothetical protein